MMKRAVAILGICLLLLVSGCGPAKRQAPNQQTPPVTPATRAAAVFFADWQAQHLIPEERQIPVGDAASQAPAGQAAADRVSAAQAAAARANAVVGALLEGPVDPTLHRTLPQGLRLMEPVTVEASVARVNLSKEFMTVQGSAGTQMALGSLLLSLTDIPGIEKVQLLVEGASALVGEGVEVGGVVDRPFYGDIPVLPDPDRPRILQERVAKGQEVWRTDPVKVLQFEGRMFGFTLAELEQGDLTVAGGKAEGRVVHGGTIYVIGLEANPEAKENPVWRIVSITSQRQEAGAAIQPVYFADRQAMNVIPEPRALVGEGGALATAVVQALLTGPTDPYLSQSLPTGTRLLRPVTVAGGVATVDLSGEMERLQGSAESSIAVNSLLFTLTEIPGVDRVQILVNGKRDAVVGNYQFTEPMARPEGPVSEQYYVDRERISWLETRVKAEPWRLDALQTLIWEGRAFGFTGEFLKTALVERQKDGAVATLTRPGQSFRIEMGQNPGEGVWYIKSLTVK